MNLLKQNQTNQAVNANENVNENETVTTNKKEPDGTIVVDDISKYTEELKNSERWIEELCILKKIPKARLLQLLDDFIIEQRVRDETHQNLKEVKNHFINWLNIQLAKPPPPPTPPKPPRFY